MSVAATLSARFVTATDGGAAVVALAVRNTSKVVDHFRVEVLGSAAPWAEVIPATVGLLPGEETAVEVRFSTPHDARLLLEDVPFAVKVTPVTNVFAAVVEEGVLQISSAIEVVADLRPRTVSARRSAGFDVILDNRGNRSAAVSLTAIEDEGLLRFRVPSVVVVAPGEVEVVPLKVVADRRRWTRHERPRPFRVVGDVDGASMAHVPGLFMQRPMLSRSVLLVALILLAGGLFLSLNTDVRSVALRPTNHRSTDDAVNTVDRAGVGAASGSPDLLGAPGASGDLGAAASAPAAAQGANPAGAVAGASGQEVITSGGPSAPGVPGSGPSAVAPVAPLITSAASGARSQASGGPLIATPLGNFENSEPAQNGVTLIGWALDPDTTESIEVHAYLNDQFASRGLANVNRPDVDAAYGRGPHHGFRIFAPTGGGTICVYAINFGGGENLRLGCKLIPATAPPFGNFEDIFPAPTGVTVKGWALDPDVTGSIEVHVYVNDVIAGGAVANVHRPDVDAVHHRGAEHGFFFDVKFNGGKICVYALNFGGGDNVLLSCKTV